MCHHMWLRCLLFVVNAYGVLPASVSVHYRWTVTMEARRDCLIPWDLRGVRYLVGSGNRSWILLSHLSKLSPLFNVDILIVLIGNMPNRNIGGS